MACWGIEDPGKGGDASSGGGPSAMAATAGDDEEAKLGTGGAEDGGDGEAVAAREHASCMGWWSGVLGRWHERTQLVDPSLQKKFRVVNQGPWAQVTASLADKERANRRAFMTESEVGADKHFFFNMYVDRRVFAPETWITCTLCRWMGG